MVRRVFSLLLVSCGVLLFAACANGEVEQWAENIWIGYVLREKEPSGVIRRRVGGPHQYEDVAASIERGQLYADEPLKADFVLAMSKLLRGHLIPAYEEFDRLEKVGFSRARLLHRAAMLGVQSGSWYQDEVIQEAIRAHLDEGKSLTQAEIDLLILAARKYSWEAVPAAMLTNTSEMDAADEIFREGQEQLDHAEQYFRNERFGSIRRWATGVDIPDFEVQSVERATDRFHSDLIAYYLASHYSDPAHRDVQKVDEYLSRAGSIEVLKTLDLQPWILAVSHLVDAALLVDRYVLADELLGEQRSNDLESRMSSHTLLKEAAVAAGQGLYDKSLEFLQVQVSDAVIYPTGSSRESVPMMILPYSRADMLYLLTAVYLLYDEFDDMLDSSYGDRIAEVFAGRFEEIESPVLLQGNGM